MVAICFLKMIFTQNNLHSEKTQMTLKRRGAYSTINDNTRQRQRRTVSAPPVSTAHLDDMLTYHHFVFLWSAWSIKHIPMLF